MKTKLISILTAGTLFVVSMLGPLRVSGQEEPHPASNLKQAPAQIQSDRISLDLKGMDVVEVIKTLASQGNLNVVIGDDVKGRVTIFLKSVKLMDAFEIILVASDLAYDRRGDIIYVMSQREYEDTYGERFADKTTAKIIQLKFAKAAEVAKALNQMKSKIGKIIVDEGSNTIVMMDSPVLVTRMQETAGKLDSPTITKVFSLTYAKAEDLKTKISESLTPGIGSMQIDERTNQVVVTDLEGKMAKIQQMITAFDEKLQQVFIEAKIVQITLNDQYKMGVDWNSFLNKLHKNSINSAFGLAARDTLNPGAQLAIGSGDPNSDYNIVVQALKSIGDANLLSSPRITVLNNQEAKILVGKTQPYAINTVTQGTATTTTATNLQFIDIGVKLYVTPVVNRDGFITMKIKPEVSSATDFYTYGSPPTTVPIVETTQAETSVTVKDGTTLIIAGLIKDDRNSQVDKVPFLGDLPLIGNAFRKTGKSINKQELVVFLTPHIVTGDNDYVVAPPSPPTGEKKFTMPEDFVFERRDRVKMDPGVFKENPVPQARGKATSFITVLPASDQEYYYVVKEKIAQQIIAPKDKTHIPLKGKVKVQFFLSSKGELLYAPEIAQSSNSSLDEAVIAAVVKAAPYPASPQKGVKQKRFVVDFSFE
ncbi:MAG: type II secretion system protein GspD [Candidatus Omnitrophica bacterium]|nr:type II secretion system protein GspD [Candidatus Omnitrophota bacterium]